MRSASRVLSYIPVLTPLASGMLAALAAGTPAAHASVSPGALRGSAVTVIANTAAAPIKIETDAPAQLAVGPAGNYVVVWAGERDKSGGSAIDSGIYLQRYNVAGKPEGAVQLVRANNATVCADVPSVAMDASGDYVVVWEELSDCTVTWSARIVKAQRFSSDGTLVSSYTVATAATFDPPSVAMDAEGDFVVAWTAYDAPYDTGVRLRFYPVNSSPKAIEPINTITADSQGRPSVSMDPAGDFIAVWRSSSFPTYLIYARRFNSAGTAIDATEFVVNDSTTALHVDTPRVAMDASGDFAVAWTTSSMPASAYVRLFNAGATPTPVATETTFATPLATGSFDHPVVAMDPEGDVIAGVFSGGGYVSSPVMRFIDSTTGQPTGAALAVPSCSVTTSGSPPTTTTHCEKPADVAMDASGDVLLLTTATAQAGYGMAQPEGLFVRAYQGETAVDLAVSVKPVAATASVGGAIGYTITVDNLDVPSSLTGVPAIDNAVGAVAGVNVTLALPDKASFVSATGQGWNCGTPTGGQLACSRDDLLTAGQSSVFTVNLTAPQKVGAAVLLATVDGPVYDTKLDNNRAAAGVSVISGGGNSNNDVSVTPSGGGGGAFGWLGLGLLGLPWARRRRKSM